MDLNKRETQSIGIGSTGGSLVGSNEQAKLRRPVESNNYINRCLEEGPAQDTKILTYILYCTGEQPVPKKASKVGDGWTTTIVTNKPV